jgi:HAD superfamily hydrolase (TIGR01509 family)
MTSGRGARLAAILFDFDGTLVDTETPEYEAWDAVYRRRGARLTLEDWAAAVGTGRDSFDPVAHLARLTGLSEDPEAVRGEMRALLALSLPRRRLRPGVRRLLDQAKRAGVRLAVVSSSGRTWVEGHLAARKVRERFDVIVTREDARYVKPHPELYQVALGRLGVDARHAVAVEDSPAGAAAALAAGLVTVVVPNRVTRGYPFPEGVVRRTSLTDVDLGALADALATRRP